MKRFGIIFLLAILVLAYLLRAHNLYTWPRKGATFDEYAWTWQGINLIKQKVPISWSPHKQYKNAKSVIYQKTHFRIVEPYLEHPPLFGLIAGSYALLNGADDMFDVDIVNIRGLAVILGLLSLIFFFMLLREVFDDNTAVLGSILYATIPSVVVGSRLVQNENFFIPFWLLSLFLVARYLKNGTAWYRNLAAVICGLLVLAKIPWVAAALSIVLIFLFLRKYKDLTKFLLIFVPIAFLFFVYGIYYDKELFLSLWGLQLNRYDISFASLYAVFLKPFLTDRLYLDGWIYFGWFSTILLFLKDIKKNLFIVFPFLAYFLVFLAGIPDEAGHGWYRYPFFPFLIASTTLFIKEYFIKNRLLTFVFLVLVGTTLFQLTWANVFGFSYFMFRIIIVGWIICLLPLFLNSKKITKISNVVSYGWLLIFILMNIWAVTLYNEQ